MTQKRQRTLEDKLDTLIGNVGEIKTNIAVIEERYRNSEKDREATQKTVEKLAVRVGGLENFKFRVIGYASGAWAVATVVWEGVKGGLFGK